MWSVCHLHQKKKKKKKMLIKIIRPSIIIFIFKLALDHSDEIRLDI